MKIKNGLKGNFSDEEIMTGIEFCELLEIDYLEIVEIRNRDGIENIEYFVEELLKISIIRDFIKKKLGLNNT